MSTTKISLSKGAMQQSRYFVTGLNTAVGQEIVELLRNDNENDVNPHIIVGTIDPNDPSEVPRGVRTVINTENTYFFTRVLLDSDAVIFDVQNTAIDEIEFALKILKYGEYQQQKTFVLLSSPLSWSNTPIKERKVDTTAESYRPSVILEDDSDTESKAFTQKYSRINDQDILIRKCPKKYELIKELELKVISAAKATLRTYVVCPGIVYGNGEQILFSHFRKAWMHPEEELNIIGDGNNILPMIHVKDLALMIKKVIDIVPNQSYVLAVDHSVKNTQKKVIQAIAQKVGGGKTKHISLQEGFTDEYYDYFTLNLYMKPTGFENVDDGLMDANKNMIMNWHSKEGFVKNAVKVRDEFKLYRALSTVKVILLGPTYGGKTTLGGLLSVRYKIPHIVIAQLIAEVANLQTDLGQRVRTTLQEVRDQMIQEALVIFEAEKKKKKVPKGQPEPEFDSSKIVPRLPDPLLIEVYKWRLQQNDAQNQGYVLDGFPKTAEQAQALFNRKIVSEDESVTFEVEESLVPKSVIGLQYTEEQVKERIKLFMTPEDIAVSRYTDDQVSKRLQKYRQNQETLFDNFKIQPLMISIMNLWRSQKELNIKILKDGPIMVLQEDVKEQDYSEKMEHDAPATIEAHQDQERKNTVTPKERENRSTVTKNSNRNDKSEIQQISRVSKLKQAEPQKKDIDEETRNEQIRAQEREILDTRSQPLRQYLADNVVPYLTEALIEICTKMPENPVLFLADYLEKKGLEVQSPFPH